MSEPGVVVVVVGTSRAREERARMVAGAARPRDTVHLAGRCPACGREATAAATVEHAAAVYRDVAELRAWLEALLAKPVALAAPDDPPEGARCACGAPASERVADRVRFARGLAGTGAELLLDGARERDPAAAGEGEGDQGGWSWRLRRASVDGFESDLPGELDDAAVVAAFGRGVSLAHAWRALLDAAAAGASEVARVEPGLWLFAGGREPSLEARVRALAAERGAEILPLKLLAWQADVPASASWPAWAREHAAAIASGDLRAGAVVDLGVLRALLRLRLAQAQASYEDDPGGPVVVWSGEVAWPLDVGRTALAATLLALTLAEAAATAVDEAGARLRVVTAFVSAARRARPDVAFAVRGGTALVPVRRDGSEGREVSLATVPFRCAPDDDEFARELRFACDEVPRWGDPTRQCPCGAPAQLVARLLPAAVVAQLPGDPVVLQRWPDDAPTAALVVALGCERHVRVPAADELARAGLGADELARRLRADLAHAVYAVDRASLHEDAGGRRALLVRGGMVATTLVDDRQLAALHEACGGPLREARAGVVAVSPDVVCAYEPAFEPAALDALMARAASDLGVPPGAAPPMLVARDARLDALPIARFALRAPVERAAESPGRAAPGG